MPCPCLNPGTEADVEAAQRHKKIEKDLKSESQRIKAQIKLLLLGAGASGKSTFVRQMRLIHGDAFTAAERKHMRLVVYDNVVTSIQALVRGMRDLGIDYEAADKQQVGEKLLNVDAQRVDTPLEFGGVCDWVAEVWADGGVQRCYERRGELELLDSCHYFLSNLRRVGTEDYVPSDEDIVHVRSPTVSVLEYNFLLDSLTYRIVDVGGQETERRKWLQCFEGVTSVIFLAALSQYTQLCQPSVDAAGRSGRATNALTDSCKLLAKVMRSKYLTQASFILFLNKNDIFEERVRHHRLKDYFPAYDGPPRNADAAYAFVEGMFLDAVPVEREQLKRKRSESVGGVVSEEPLIYCHRTTATDIDNIRRIFNAVRDTILERFLSDFNIV